MTPRWSRILRPAPDYADSDVDLRHRFVFSPVYEFGTLRVVTIHPARLLSDYSLSSIVQLNPASVSANIGTDLNATATRATTASPARVATTSARPTCTSSTRA